MYSCVEGSSPTHVSALSAALQVAGELAELQTVTAQQAARLAQLTQQLQQGQEELAASRAQQDATQQQLQQREAELAGQVGLTEQCAVCDCDCSTSVLHDRAALESISSTMQLLVCCGNAHQLLPVGRNAQVHASPLTTKL
jgi:TolA-binding protein